MSEGLQLAPWPRSYKAITPLKFDGISDPRQFIMSYEAAVTSAGGDDTTLAKTFIVALEGAALDWFTELPPRSIYSSEKLRDELLENYKGFKTKQSTADDLWACKQKEGGTLQAYYTRFLHVKAHTSNVSDSEAIRAAIKGLRTGLLATKLAKKPPTSLQQMYEKFEKYCRSKADYLRRLAEQNSSKQP